MDSQHWKEISSEINGIKIVQKYLSSEINKNIVDPKNILELLLSNLQYINASPLALKLGGIYSLVCFGPLYRFCKVKAS